MYFENLSFEVRRELVGIAYRSWILLVPLFYWEQKVQVLRDNPVNSNPPAVQRVQEEFEG